MPYYASIAVDFSYGHRLLRYSGKCKNLHGHNGRAEFIFKADGLDSSGMVSDFSRSRRRIKKWIDENWDHRLILCRKDPWLAKLRSLDPTVVAIKENPTAENLAKIIFAVVRRMGYPLLEARLWESRRSWAAYRISSA